MGGLSDREMKHFFTPARRALLRTHWEVTLCFGLIKIHETWRKVEPHTKGRLERVYYGDQESPESICKKEKIPYE